MMKPLLKTIDLIRIFGVSKQTIMVWRNEGMPYTGSKKSFRYNYDDVLEWHKGRDSADKVKEVLKSNYPTD